MNAPSPARHRLPWVATVMALLASLAVAVCWGVAFAIVIAGGAVAFAFSILSRVRRRAFTFDRSGRAPR